MELSKVSTMADVFVIAAQSMSEAVTTHGPQAVELGLFVYRLEGLKVIGLGLLALALSVGLVVGLYKNHHAQTKDKWSEGAIFLQLALYVLLVLSNLAAVAQLSSVYHWAAALGYPEVLIAYKALQAAGIM